MLEIRVDPGHKVSALVQLPPNATAGLVLAHGAGAGMTHPFMAAVADGLAACGVATLRYQFPYMEAGGQRPDRPPLAQATVRAAVEAASKEMSGLPLVAGGKSFGGRMTSQAQAVDPLPGVRGLVFFGFPLHPAKKPSDARAAHLADVRVPMLFLQGTRDALAEIDMIRVTTARLGRLAALEAIEEGDHSFHVPKRTGRSDAEVMAAMLDAVRGWIARVIAGGG